MGEVDFSLMRVAYFRPGKDSWPSPDGAPAGWSVDVFSQAEKLEEALRDHPYDAAVVRLSAELNETLSRLRVAATGLPVLVAAAAGRAADAAA